MHTHEYLVEMNFPPFGTLLTPQEVTTFTERFVLPSFEILEKLTASGKIVAGGTALAAIGFIFIARVESPQELEDIVAGIPLWARSQTRIVPLGTFSSRAATIRARFAKTSAALANPEGLNPTGSLART